MSLSRLVWTMTRILRRLWVRASLYCLVAIATALAAIWIGPILPAAFPSKVGAKAVDAILSIIASSMLAVTTFSLSTLVAATSAAASSATPRATSLLLEDATSQRALSTFLGAFLFSLVGLIALNTELYDDGGRFVLFVATLGLVAIIVVTLLRWIDHLAGLGHMGETIGRVEKAATETYRAHTHAPFLGGTPAETVPEGAIAIRHKRIGYVQHLDMGALSTVADEADGDIYVTRRPGHYCDPARPIAWIALRDRCAKFEIDQSRRISEAFTLGNRRSYDQDPRFGLIALSEIASKALSPGINDSGTAIDVLATLVRVLSPPQGEDPSPVAKPEYARVHVAALEEDDIIEAAFMPISRDGAAILEVAIRLQKALAAIWAGCEPPLAGAARRFAAVALQRSLESLTFEPDRERLRREARASFRKPKPMLGEQNASTPDA